MTSNSVLTRPSSQESLCDVTVLPKQPLKKLDFALKRIAKVVTLHLEFLLRHKCNIEKFERSGDVSKLNEEHINASRTVQQLKADMYELEIIGQQVIPEDLHQFEAQANVIKNDILKEIAAFVGEYQESIQPCTALRSLSLPQGQVEGSVAAENNEGSGSAAGQRSPTPPCVAFPASASTEELLTRSMSFPSTMDQVQLQESLRPDVGTSRSWNVLNKEILDLNSLIKRFAQSVRSQREAVDRIESNVEVTRDNVTEGTLSLRKAARYKLALLPISGALIGGIVGGPVGLVAGYKAGAAVGLGGGILGFCGARYIQKRQYTVLNNNNSVELEDMSNRKLKNSLSLNDLKT